MTTNVYVDGPSLYYGALKDRPGRWLDLQTWCERLLPDHDIERVRYFTAWANPAFDQGKAIASASTSARCRRVRRSRSTSAGASGNVPTCRRLAVRMNDGA